MLTGTAGGLPSVANHRTMTRMPCAGVSSGSGPGDLYLFVAHQRLAKRADWHSLTHPPGSAMYVPAV